MNTDEIMLEEANTTLTVEDLCDIYFCTGIGFVANGGIVTEVVKDGTGLYTEE